jgi:hypothetical protein
MPAATRSGMSGRIDDIGFRVSRATGSPHWAMPMRIASGNGEGHWTRRPGESGEVNLQQ